MPLTDMNTIRVMLIDDHHLLRACLRILLESRTGLSVCAEAATPAEALGSMGRESPDIILLDLDLDNASSLDWLPELRARIPTAPVVILTGAHNTEIHRRAVRLGARGMVFREHDVDVFFEAILTVHTGGLWLDSPLLMSSLDRMKSTDPKAAKIEALSTRERRVIGLIGQGFKHQAIADRLRISDAAVRHHLTSIFTRLGVGRRGRRRDRARVGRSLSRAYPALGNARRKAKWTS